MKTGAVAKVCFQNILIVYSAVREEDDSTNDENNQQKDERRYMMDSTRLKATPRTPRFDGFSYYLKVFRVVGRKSDKEGALNRLAIIIIHFEIP